MSAEEIQLLEIDELSEPQREFLDEHPFSHVYRGAVKDSVIVYEYGTTSVDRFIINQSAEILDHNFFKSGEADLVIAAALRNPDVVDKLNDLWEMESYDGPRH